MLDADVEALLDLSASHSLAEGHTHRTGVDVEYSGGAAVVVHKGHAFMLGAIGQDFHKIA